MCKVKVQFWTRSWLNELNEWISWLEEVKLLGQKIDHDVVNWIKIMWIISMTFTQSCGNLELTEEVKDDLMISNFNWFKLGWGVRPGNWWIASTDSPVTSFDCWIEDGDHRIRISGLTPSEWMKPRLIQEFFNQIRSRYHTVNSMQPT